MLDISSENISRIRLRDKRLNVITHILIAQQRILIEQKINFVRFLYGFCLPILLFTFKNNLRKKWHHFNTQNW